MLTAAKKNMSASAPAENLLSPQIPYRMAKQVSHSSANGICDEIRYSPRPMPLPLFCLFDLIRQCTPQDALHCTRTTKRQTVQWDRCQRILGKARINDRVAIA